MKATFYHAGCSVCVDAEHQILHLLADSVSVEVVHLGDTPAKVAEAKAAGVVSVPALVTEGSVPLHLNYGAALSDLEQAHN